MGRKEKLLVIAKAYPEYSKRYHSFLMCTAGLTEEGEWRRIFPIPIEEFFKITFKKREWIEYEIRDEHGDHRKESKKIFPATIRPTGKYENIETIRSIFKKECTSLESLSEKYKDDKTSIGIIKPTLLSFEMKERNNSLEKEAWLKFQITLFPTIGVDILHKYPRYIFKCNRECNSYHKIMCEDVEAIELCRKLNKKYGENGAYDAIKEKLFDWMKTRELYFVVGTHYIYATWIIISLVYPEKRYNRQITEFSHRQ